jgi:hypothetical protein
MFVQTEVTSMAAMGTKMAPSYANIFMGDLEERLLLSSLKQPLSWLRFIDDADMKWIHSDKEIDDFFVTLMAWMNGILLKQCLGWQQLGERY